MRLTVKVTDRSGHKRGPLVDVVGRLRKGASVSVGVLSGASHPSGMDNATLAAIHEFGTEDGRVPERSFLRSTMSSKREEWLAFFAGRARKVVAGQISALDAMEHTGMRMAGDVKAAIVAGIDPENAPATVAAKGSSTPLIDTGRLKESITHRVTVGKVQP